MTVRELMWELELQSKEIELRVYDDSYDNLLHSYTWECDMSGFPNNDDDDLEDALDTEVRFIYSEWYKDVNGISGSRLVIESAIPSDE